MQDKEVEMKTMGMLAVLLVSVVRLVLLGVALVLAFSALMVTVSESLALLGLIQSPLRAIEVMELIKSINIPLFFGPRDPQGSLVGNTLMFWVGADILSSLTKKTENAS